MRVTANLALAVLLLCAAGSSGAQTASDGCSSPRQAQDPLVGAFRVLNTAEMVFRETNHRFAKASELLDFPETRKLSANTHYSQPVPGSIVLGSVDDLLPGYTLRLSVGDDGESFTITATKKAGPCAGVGATTDERGVIYFIEPLP